MELRTLLIASTLVVPLVGCADMLTDHETRSQYVKDGTIDTETTAALGFVRTNGNETGFCSAALIAPHLALTARNCAAPVGGEYIECLSTTFEDPYDPATMSVTTAEFLSSPSDGYTGVLAVVVPEDPSVCGNDLAVLILDEPVDATPFAPAMTTDLAAGDAYAFYGYGAIGDGTQSGRRRTSTGEIQCVGDGCDATTMQNAANEFVGIDGSCIGDAGGPAVVDGTVVGLSSRGTGNCESSTHTMVGSFGDLLLQAANQASEDHGYPLPEWAGGMPENNGTGTNNASATNNQAGTNNDTATNNAAGTNGDGSNDGEDGTSEAGEDSGCSTIDRGPGESPVALLLALAGLMFTRRRR